MRGLVNARDLGLYVRMSLSWLASGGLLALVLAACAGSDGSNQASPSDSPPPSPTSGVPEPETSPGPCDLIDLPTMTAIMGEPITAHGGGTTRDGYCAYSPVDSRPDLLTITWKPAPDQARLADLPDLGDDDEIQSVRVPGASDALLAIRNDGDYFYAVDLFAVADTLLYEVHSKVTVLGNTPRRAATLAATEAISAHAR